MHFAGNVESTASVILRGQRRPVRVEFVTNHAEAVEDLLSLQDRGYPVYGFTVMRSS